MYILTLAEHDLQFLQDHGNHNGGTDVPPCLCLQKVVKTT